MAVSSRGSRGDIASVLDLRVRKTAPKGFRTFGLFLSCQGSAGWGERLCKVGWIFGDMFMRLSNCMGGSTLYGCRLFLMPSFPRVSRAWRAGQVLQAPPIVSAHGAAAAEALNMPGALPPRAQNQQNPPNVTSPVHLWELCNGCDVDNCCLHYCIQYPMRFAQKAKAKLKLKPLYRSSRASSSSSPYELPLHSHTDKPTNNSEGSPACSCHAVDKENEARRIACTSKFVTRADANCSISCST